MENTQLLTWLVSLRTKAVSVTLIEAVCPTPFCFKINL